MFCRNGGILSGGIKSVQGWEDSIDFNQGLITVAETFKAFPTILAVLEETLIHGFSLRTTS